MTTEKPIAIPLSHQFRRFRLRWLPQLVFALSVVAISFLWRHHGEFANGVGEVEAVRVDVAAATTGQLVPLSQVPWTLFDSVTEGQLIARLDDRLINAELLTLSAELTRLNKKVAATQTKLEFDQADLALERQREAVRLAWQIEQLRLNGLDRDVKLAIDEVEVRRLEARLEVLTPLIKRGYSSELEAIDARGLRDAAVARIQSAKSARAEVAEQFDSSLERLKETTAVELPEVTEVLESVLGPVRAELATQAAKIDELKLELERLEIRSPITGTITAIHLWPGQVATPGEPIVTVAAEQGRFIVSYVRDDQRINPEIGATVGVRLRGTKPQRFDATIDQIGPQVQPVPEHQLVDRTQPEWGVPLRIALPDDFSARPGQLVDITFRRKR